MMRRVLAALGCTALLLVLTVQAQPPAAATKPKPGDAPAAKTAARPVDASADTAIGKTSTLAREYKEFEALLLNLAQRMEKSPRSEDKAKAEALRTAINLANKENVENRFSKLLTTLVGKDSSRNLTTDDLEKAAGQNDEMIKILLTDSELLKKQQEIARLQEALKQINVIINKEKIEQSVIDGKKVD